MKYSSATDTDFHERLTLVAPLDASLPRWKTATVAAPEQTLKALVKDELRGPVSELVRQVVVELVHEQLNGHATDPEMAALGAQLPSRATNGAAKAPDPSGELRHTPHISLSLIPLLA